MVQQLQLRPNLNRFGLLIGAFFFWLSALFCSVSAADLLPIPEVAYVTDTAHLLTAEQKRSLEAKLAGFEEKYGSQIAVIIVPSTNGEPIEDYAHRVGDNWKLGRKDVGDGLLLIVAVNDHRIRIDVMRALEGAIPDVAASRIITDVMAPNFRQNNYYQGISQALDKVFTLIEDAKLPAPQKKRSEANILYDPAEALWDEPWVAVLFIGFVITMMLRELMGRKSAPLAGLAVGGLAAFIMQSLFAGIVIALIVVVIAMCIPTAVLEAGARRTAKMYGTDRRYRGKRGGGDDGFGGFGGFGGGGFGGGGFGGGMGGGAGSGGGGDAAGGGASGGWEKMSIGRILKHWVMSPVPVTLAFPQSSLDAVTKCIEECEQQTSAEFRLIIERSIPSKGLRENITDAQRAKELFGRYGVWDTEDNNGVLIYLNLSDRAIEIYLDRGAAREVAQTQLDDIVKQMEIAFADKKFVEGVCQAFRSLAAILSKPFPNKPVQDPVPNTPVVL